MKTTTKQRIESERANQDNQWGGLAHDKKHTPMEWASYIHYQAAQASQNPQNAIERFVKVAALAVAAIEALENEQ